MASLCKQEIGAAFIEQNGVMHDLLSGDIYCGRDGFSVITAPDARINLGVESTMQASAAADAIRDEIDAMSADGWLTESFSRWGYLSGRSVAYVFALRILHQRERWTQAAAGVFAILFLLALWQTYRFFRESTRARLAETALLQSMSESRRMEEDLRENKSRLEEAQHMAHVGSFITDQVTVRMEWSEELYRIFELDPVRCDPSLDLVLWATHPDDRPLVREKIEDSVRRKGRCEFEHRILLPDGRNKFVLVTLTISASADGKLLTRGTVQDITERKRAEQEKAKLEAQMRQAHKMESIGRLAGGVAHDFNNLLTVINGYSHVLIGQLESPVRRYAEQINKAGESAASLTRQLLAFSRMEVTNPQQVHLNTIMAEARDMLGRLVGVEIEIETRPGAFQDQVLADPNQMQQCLMNLVVNARDAMPSGGRITIETANAEVAACDVPTGSNGAPGPHVRLAVHDTGTGMDEETSQRIFEPFFTTKEKGKGTGLGLSTVYGIVSQCGGFLVVRSERGKGSEFSTYLPLNVSLNSPGATPSAEAGMPQAESETVLVVDDQEIVREFVAEVLRLAGYEVIEAGSGAEALEFIESKGPGIDLMMTDVMMPGMRSKDLAKRANAVNPSLKVLFMTGYTDDSAGSFEAPDATDEVIMKPFAPEALEARVRSLLHPANGHVDSAGLPAPGAKRQAGNCDSPRRHSAIRFYIDEGVAHAS